MLRSQRPVSVSASYVLATLAAVFALQISPSYAEENVMERTITVSATGTAIAEPDEARITSGVSTEKRRVHARH
jgi:uncharacterized protein YggE